MGQTEKLTLIINSDSKKAASDLRSMADALDKVDDSAGKADKKVSSLGKAFSVAAKGALTLAAGLVGVAAKGLQGAAKLEQTSISLEVMTGSAKQAAKTLAELEKFAQITPFKTDEVLAAGKTLIAFGESTETVTLTLQRLGDVASLTGQRTLQEMSVMFAKMRQAGTVYTEDLNQLMEAGVDVWGELGKITGKNAAELKKMASQGKITSDQIEQVFINMTKEGGKAFNMMAKQSKSLTGMWSTTTSIFDKLATNMGAKLVPMAKSALSIIIENQDAIMKLGSTIGDGLVIAFKALASAGKFLWAQLMDVKALWDALGPTAQKVVMGLGIIVIAVKALMAVFTLMASINPFFLLIAKIALIIIVIAKLRKNWDVVVAAIWLGIAKVQDGFEIMGLAIKAAIFTLLSWLLKAYGRMFSPIIKGINIVISAYNKFAGKAIKPLKNVALAGSKWAKWHADQASKQMKVILKGSKRTTDARAALSKALADKKKKDEKDGVKSKKEADKSIVDSTTRTTKKMAALNKKAAKKAKTEWQKTMDALSQGVSDFAGQFNTAMGLLDDIMGMVFGGMIKETEAFYDSQIRAQEDSLQSRLESEGLAEESTLQKLQREFDALKERRDTNTNEAEKAALNEEAIEKEKELKREQIMSSSAKNIEKIEADKANAIKKIKRDQAIYEKAASIASATVSGFQAVVSALTLPPPFGFIAAAIIGGLAATQIGFMAAQPIPAAEDGALIRGSSAGQIIRAGENNKSELIVPFENEDVMSQLGGGGGQSITVIIENLYGDRDIPDKVAMAFDKAMYKLKQDGNSRFAKA